MEVNPYTALVGLPPEVAKFSTGKAKNARKAMDNPSISNKGPFDDSLTDANLVPMTDDDVVDPFQFRDGLIGRLGIEIQELTPERVVGTMPIEGNTQPYGLLHGGATAALAETLGSFGAMAHAQPDKEAVGVDLNITHHRAVTHGIVTGVATAVHLGRTVATYAITINDDQSRVVATARLTCVLKTLP